MKLVALKSLLKEKHITQKQLAEDLGINDKTLSGYVSDSKKNEPDFETVLMIARYLHVTPEYLYGVEHEAYSVSKEDLKRLRELNHEIDKILEKYK